MAEVGIGSFFSVHNGRVVKSMDRGPFPVVQISLLPKTPFASIAIVLLIAHQREQLTVGHCGICAEYRAAGRLAAYKDPAIRAGAAVQLVFAGGWVFEAPMRNAARRCDRHIDTPEPLMSSCLAAMIRSRKKPGFGAELGCGGFRVFGWVLAEWCSQAVTARQRVSWLALAARFSFLACAGCFCSVQLSATEGTHANCIFTRCQSRHSCCCPVPAAVLVAADGANNGAGLLR